MNAAKERIGEDDVAALFAGARKVHVMKGKKVEVLDLAKDPDAAAELPARVLGPTGNLRAPTIRVGKTWLVGFNEEAYAELLG